MTSKSVLTGMTVIAALMMAAAASTAHAKHCSEDPEGHGVAHGSGHHATREALHAAIDDWKKEVHEECGYWPTWRHAMNKRKSCEVEDRGKKTECEVEATPAPHHH